MKYTYRILTLNINGIEAHNRISMLEEFVHRHDIDIDLLQEVTDGDKLVCKGYQSIINMGTTGRGTAILQNLNTQFHRIERIPSGRGWLCILMTPVS
jgi:exonuclease III